MRTGEFICRRRSLSFAFSHPRTWLHLHPHLHFPHTHTPTQIEALLCQRNASIPYLPLLFFLLFPSSHSFSHPCTELVPPISTPIFAPHTRRVVMFPSEQTPTVEARLTLTATDVCDTVRDPSTPVAHYYEVSSWFFFLITAPLCCQCPLFCLINGQCNSHGRPASNVVPAACLLLQIYPLTQAAQPAATYNTADGPVRPNADGTPPAVVLGTPITVTCNGWAEYLSSNGYFIESVELVPAPLPYPQTGDDMASWGFDQDPDSPQPPPPTFTVDSELEPVTSQLYHRLYPSSPPHSPV